MIVHDKTIKNLFATLNTSELGLNDSSVQNSKKVYGENKMSKVKGKTLFKRIIDALLEPMLIILEIAMVITLGVNLGKFLKTGNGDFYECIGIFLSIAISVFLIVVLITKYVSLGSITAVSVYPILAFVPYFGMSIEKIVLGVATPLIVIFMHRANIKRLIKGEETKFRAKSKKD
jgi:hypothetical protein